MLASGSQRLSVLLSLFIGAALGLESSGQQVKRDLESVNCKYDYIVVGGGTSGLVVANRLSEASNKTVLVVEYGDFANTINVTVPYLTTQDQTARLYDMPSVPQANLGGRVANLRIGNVVGGSSTINGMAWDRGSAVDYDSWEELNNPGWGWETLLAYFRRSSRFSPPDDEYIEKYGYAWSPEAYGDGPIHVGYPPWQWPTAGECSLSLRSGPSRLQKGATLRVSLTVMKSVELQAQAWSEDLDAPVLADGADGKNVGLAWLPQNSDAEEAVRSSAETAYYHPVSDRPNLHLLVRHYGGPIKFQDGVTRGIKIFSRDGGESKFVSSKNVILAAGTVNTPRILQLSGVGPRKLLESLDIDVIVDAPGVGANFQDHPSFFMIYECEWTFNY